jgi:hypothetical protein
MTPARPGSRPVKPLARRSPKPPAGSRRRIGASRHGSSRGEG